MKNIQSMTQSRKSRTKKAIDYKMLGYRNPIWNPLSSRGNLNGNQVLCASLWRPHVYLLSFHPIFSKGQISWRNYFLEVKTQCWGVIPFLITWSLKEHHPFEPAPLKSPRKHVGQILRFHPDQLNHILRGWDLGVCMWMNPSGDPSQTCSKNLRNKWIDVPTSYLPYLWWTLRD